DVPRVVQRSNPGCAEVVMVAVLEGGHDEEHPDDPKFGEHWNCVAELARQRVIKRKHNATRWEVLVTAHTCVNRSKAHWLQSRLAQPVDESLEAGRNWHFVGVEHRTVHRLLPNGGTVR